MNIVNIILYYIWKSLASWRQNLGVANKISVSSSCKQNKITEICEAGKLEGVRTWPFGTKWRLIQRKMLNPLLSAMSIHSLVTLKSCWNKKSNLQNRNPAPSTRIL